MKKFVIGIAVLGIFAVYSLGIRHQNTVLANPSHLTNNNGSSSGSKSVTTSTVGSGNGPAPNNNGEVSSGSSSSPTPASSSSKYKDGSYSGSVADAYYGNVQVQAIISGGKITDVKFLQYPNTHSTSVRINQQAMPYLKQEAIQVQGSNVQIISGATFTSQAFQQSLQVALSQA